MLRECAYRNLSRRFRLSHLGVIPALEDGIEIAEYQPTMMHAKATMRRDLTVSKRMDIDTWRSRPAPERARDWLWSYFGEVF